jgi:hypothetical protein
MSAKAVAAFRSEEFTPAKVHFVPGLIENIAHLVLDGYSATSHGGLEIGGLLFGRRSTGSITVEEFRPMPCDHSLGPRFILSERDERGLRDLLKTSTIDPALKGLDAIGWYCSHTRSDLLLCERELVFHDTYFSGPVDFVIVFKPREMRSVTAGIFLRGADRIMDPRRPATVLDLPELAASSRPANGRSTSHGHDLWSFSRPAAASLNECASVSELSTAIEAPDQPFAKSGPVIISYPSQSDQHIRRAVQWKILLPVVAAVALLSFGIWRYTRRAQVHPAEVLITLHPGPGNLVLSWKSNVAKAQRARVDILDGTASQHLNITDIFQPSGVLLFPHNAGNVQAVLSIETGQGVVVRRAGFTDPSALVRDPIHEIKNSEPTALTNQLAVNPPVHHPRRRHARRTRHRKSIPANTSPAAKQVQANQSP